MIAASHGLTVPGHRPIAALILNHANAVNGVDRVHASVQRLYLWAGNRLRPIGDLDGAALAEAARLIRDETAARKACAEGGRT